MRTVHCIDPCAQPLQLHCKGGKKVLCQLCIWSGLLWEKEQYGSTDGLSYKSHAKIPENSQPLTQLSRSLYKWPAVSRWQDPIAPEGNYLLVPSVWGLAGDWIMQTSHRCVGRWCESFAYLPSWTTWQNLSWESPLLPKTRQSCFNHQIVFSFLICSFSSQTSKLSHHFVGGSALLHVPVRDIGHKG